MVCNWKYPSIKLFTNNRHLYLIYKIGQFYWIKIIQPTTYTSKLYVIMYLNHKVSWTLSLQYLFLSIKEVENKVPMNIPYPKLSVPLYVITDAGGSHERFIFNFKWTCTRWIKLFINYRSPYIVFFNSTMILFRTTLFVFRERHTDYDVIHFS